MSTYRDYFTLVLESINAPVTDGNLDALYAVSTFEGIQGTGGNGPQRYNPLNSVVPHGDSTKYNDVGVQDYKSFENGVAGTVELLRGDPWREVVHVMRQNDGTPAVLSAFARVYQGWDAGVTAGSFPLNPNLGNRQMGQSGDGSSTGSSGTQTDGTPRAGSDYTVRAGDTLWGISETAYGTGTAYLTIAEANGIGSPYTIHPGQELTIPSEGEGQPVPRHWSGFVRAVYTVREGDTLWGIADRFYGSGTAWEKIASFNRLSDPDLIHPGEVLKIPH